MAKFPKRTISSFVSAIDKTKLKEIDQKLGVTKEKKPRKLAGLRLWGKKAK